MILIRNNLRMRAFSSKVTRSLPMADLRLKDHDPELYSIIQDE